MICPNCKKEIEPGAWFCPFCASQLATDDFIKTQVDDIASYDVELRESSAWQKRDSSSDAVIVGDFVPILEPDEAFDPQAIPHRTEAAIAPGLTPYEDWVATNADGIKTVRALQTAALMSDEEMRVTMLTLLDRGFISLTPPPMLDPALLVEVREELKPPPKIVARPDRAKLLHEAALHDREAGNFVSARMNLKLAIALDPDNQQYAALYVDLLAEKPPPSLIDHVGAQQLFNEATHAEAAGDFDRAIAILEKAIKLSRHPVLLNRAGVLYATKKRDFVKAKELLEGAVEAAPYNPAYVHNLNKVLGYVTPEHHGRDGLWQRIVKKEAVKGLRIFDKYEIIRRLATGGMGDIFLARQLGIAGFHRLVVLKSLRPEIVEREDVLAMFLNEARTAAKMNHPNIVAVYEIDEYRGIYFIAMELIQGADLRTLFRASEWHKQRIPYRVAAEIIREAALGLDHAHRAPGESGELLSIVHRDVSPANIMVRLDGVTKVVDFGIAAATTLESRAKVQGKLRYMSPEQILGLPVDGGADQFSLGIVLWELITGQRLFDDVDASKVLEQIAVDAIRTPSSIVSDIPRELEEITMKMLARTRIERFHHLAEVAASLGEVVYRAGSPPEQQVARFVQALVGKQVTQMTQNLEVEEVAIPGLLDAAEHTCRACGEKNSMRNRFCASCGKPLAKVMPSNQKVRLDDPTEDVPAPARARVVRELLFDEAASLGDLLESETKDVAVLAAYVRGREKLMRELDGPSFNGLEKQLVDGLAAVAEKFGVLVLRLTREEVLLVFGTDGRSILEPMRAVECALELERAVEGVHRNLSLSIAVDKGPAAVDGGKGARNTARGEVIDRAPKLASIAAAVGKKGVVVTDLIARSLEGLVKLAPETLAIEGKAIACLRLVSLSPRAFAAGIPLVGRKDELAAAREAIGEAREGSSSALLFFGAPGSGKTRLLREVGELARRLDAKLKQLSELADDFNVAVLLSDAEKKTIVILADDIHLLEPDAFERLASIAQRSAKLHLAIIATADASRAPTLDLAWAMKLDLRPLSDEKMLAVAQHRLEGKPLPPAAAQLVLERAQGSPRALLLVLDALIDRGGLVKEGDRWVARDEIYKLILPVRAEDLLLERVEHLSREAKSFLRVAAVAGETFSGEVVGAALAVADHERVLAECLKSGLINEVLSHRGAYQIVDRTLRTTLLARFPALDLEAVHTRLAEVLDESPERTLPGVLAAIARHRIAARAGVPAANAAVRAADVLGKTRQAGELYKEAVRIRAEDLAAGRILDATTALELNDLAARATRCFAAFDLERADKMLAPIAEHVPEKLDPAGRAIALTARGSVRLSLGRLDDADKDLARAMELALAAREHDVTSIALPRAAVWEARGRLSEAAELLKQTIAAAPPGASLWECSNALGRLYFRMGQTERAALLFDAAVDEASGLGHALGAIKAMVNRALVAATLKQHDEALLMLDRAESQANTAGEVLERSRISYNRGRILLERGDADDARNAFTRALEDAHAARWNEGIALATQAIEALSRR